MDRALVALGNVRECLFQDGAALVDLLDSAVQWRPYPQGTWRVPVIAHDHPQTGCN